MLKNKLLFFMALTAISLVFAVSVMAKGSVDVSINTSKSSFSSKEGVMVDVTIKNSGKQSVRLLKWFTPIDGIEEPIFKVSFEGKEVEFVGPHYKRPAPTEKDFYILRGGQSVTRTVDLADFYDFSQSGRYEISYDGSALNREKSTIEQIDLFSGNNVNVYVEGRAVKVPEPSYPDAVSGTTSFTKCTTTQQTDALNARNNASIYAADALGYLNAGTVGLRYTTWFGVYDAGRYSTVRNHFVNISGAMDNAPVTINCGCKKTYYAYVFPNQPYTIYVCKAFWTAPMTGTDSKAGTLIHEMSHFTVVAGTDDWAYGQTAAKNLAISNPTNAVDNADSHEYFAENTPFQN